MPQMMPINWLFFFLFFICIFILFNIFNYYIFLFKKKNNFIKNNSKKNLNWKW